MWIIGSVLAALALLLAWPVPVLLHRRRRTTPDPSADLVLWQSIGLSGGLSLIGALIAVALAPLGDNLPTALFALTSHPLSGEDSVLTPLRAVILVVALAALCHLAGMLIYSAIRAAQRSRRHRALVHLLTTPSASHPHTRILPTDRPVAYCLSSGGRPTTVLSSGLVELLDDEERRAVIEHEAAHLRLRHDLLTLPFLAWRKASPGFYAPRAALDSVRELIELMADDAARQRVDPAVLRSAIAKTSAREHTAPPPEVASRLTRLDAPLPAPRPGRRIALWTTAIGLFLVPTLLVIVIGL